LKLTQVPNIELEVHSRSLCSFLWGKPRPLLSGAKQTRMDFS